MFQTEAATPPSPAGPGRVETGAGRAGAGAGGLFGNRLGSRPKFSGPGRAACRDED